MSVESFDLRTRATTGLLQRGLARVLWALGGFGEVLVAAYAVPLCILAIGTPIALVVRLVMWTVGAL